MFELKEIGKGWPTFSQELVDQGSSTLLNTKNRLKGCGGWAVGRFRPSRVSREWLPADHWRMRCTQSSKQTRGRVENERAVGRTGRGLNPDCTTHVGQVTSTL